ncbi:uncharacterized protein UDID_17766 [Ustilago sp. UG-2017a]|nr:uncharacterized protein UDID_17766 [Ustilago sp. UG-2017a]
MRAELVEPQAETTSWSFTRTRSITVLRLSLEMRNARSWPIAIARKRVQDPSRIVSPPLNTPRYRTIRRLTSLDPDRDIPLALQPFTLLQLSSLAYTDLRAILDSAWPTRSLKQFALLRRSVAPSPRRLAAPIRRFAPLERSLLQY